MKNFFKRFGPSLLALGTATLTMFTPALQGAIAHHPAVSGALAAIAAILSHLAPSPLSK